MISIQKGYGKVGISVLVGALVAWGLYAFYWGHLAAQEQYQCFLYGESYMEQHLTLGGPLLYAAEWLTQFFISPIKGAIIVAALLIILQGLTWLVATRNKEVSCGYYVLSFVPSVCMLWAMMDGNVLLSLPLSATLWMGAAWLSLSPTKRWAQVLLGVLLTAVLIPSTLPANFVYYRLIETPTSLLCIPLAACVFTPILLHFLPALEKRGTWIIGGLTCALLLIGGTMVVRSAMQKEQEEFMRFNYLERNKAWDTIILRAQSDGVKSREAAICVNLALAMRGEMQQNMHLTISQWGEESLLPEFHGEWQHTMVVSDAFYYMGLINTAQRYAFDAQEAIPNMKKSARCLKMLAETNIVNGDYRVARKYLNLLSQTLYYRQWAQEVLHVIADEQEVEKQPMWQKLRKMRVQDDLISTSSRKHQLKALMEHDSTNYLATNYAMVYLSLSNPTNVAP